jgi:hypothetical protein
MYTTKKAKSKEFTHMNLYVFITLLSLLRYRSDSFNSRRARAVEKAPIIYDKTEHKNETYVRYEMRYTSFEKIQSYILCWI